MWFFSLHHDFMSFFFTSLEWSRRSTRSACSTAAPGLMSSPLAFSLSPSDQNNCCFISCGCQRQTFFRSRETRQIGKGVEHEEIQSSDGDFLDFLMSPWDMFCTDLPDLTLRCTAVSWSRASKAEPSPTFQEGVQTSFLWQQTLCSSLIPFLNTTWWHSLGIMSVSRHHMCC